MAEKEKTDNGSALGNKTRHVLSQMWLGLKRGAQFGAIVGVVAGCVMAVAATGPISLLGFLGGGLLGGLIGSAAGMNTGGFIGGIKGLFTRAKPDGDAMMKDAEACAQLSPAPAPEAQQGQQQAAGKPTLPAPPGTGKNPAHAAVGVTNPDAKPGAITPETLNDLKTLTQTLNQIQANAETIAPPAAAPAAPAAPSAQRMQEWQARMRQEAAQQREMTNQR